ncbi:MAG: hypothetical protein FWG01_04210 [Betaproteobacteria bacterium]|nr:hypothetical protein [Betaproteobacteria bacterium]
MRMNLRRILLWGLFCVLAAPFAASAASVPDGAVIRVKPFAFPQAAYIGAEEEAERLSAAFGNQLISALQQAGLAASVLSEKKGVQGDTQSVPDKQQKTKPVPTGKKGRSTQEALADGEDDLFADEEDGVKDALMAAVEEAEGVKKEEPEREAAAGAEKGKMKPSAKSDAYIITGTVTQYEEHVGVPVKSGATRRSRAEVTLRCSYQVKNPAGRTILSEETAASSSRVVTETVDIHAALQNLSRKVFFEASYNIAERVSGKTRVKSKDNAESGSEDDEYADSPGKRLQQKAR